MVLLVDSWPILLLFLLTRLFEQKEYEVTTEDKVAASNPPPAQISLTDCLACSGCVTSAEAMLVSLQSHEEVLNALDSFSSLPLPWSGNTHGNGDGNKFGYNINSAKGNASEGKVFIATVSPQSRASLAALYGTSSSTAGHMISQLLAGPSGLASGGRTGSHFAWVLDSNVFREIALALSTEEVAMSTSMQPKKPILTSACPGWICYVEKTHPHILPHLSRLKSPQALAGTMIKSLLWKKYGIPPSRVWHLAVMPCFDKKLEASRAELQTGIWDDVPTQGEAVRDVDCVITARELLGLAQSRNINMAELPIRNVKRPRLPDAELDEFLFPRGKRRKVMQKNGEEIAAGTSGGYLWHVLQNAKASCPNSRIEVERGRNADVVEYRIVRENVNGTKDVLLKVAKYYGFKNITNLVRRLRPAKTSRLPGTAKKPSGVAATRQGHTDYSYVEVMACPGGCTNGGGQIKAADLETLGFANQELEGGGGVADQRRWLGKIDEAYWSASGESRTDEGEEDMENGSLENGHAMDIDMPNRVHGARHRQDEGGGGDIINGVSKSYAMHILRLWSEDTGVDVDTLCYTTYRAVESDVGKSKGSGKSDVERVAGLAVQVGGGW